MSEHDHKNHEALRQFVLITGVSMIEAATIVTVFGLLPDVDFTAVIVVLCAWIIQIPALVFVLLHTKDEHSGRHRHVPPDGVVATSEHRITRYYEPFWRSGPHHESSKKAGKETKQKED